MLQSPQTWRNKVRRSILSDSFWCQTKFQLPIQSVSLWCLQHRFSLSDICNRSKSYSTHLEPGLSCCFMLSFLSWLLMFFLALLKILLSRALYRYAFATLSLLPHVDAVFYLFSTNFSHFHLTPEIHMTLTTLEHPTDLLTGIGKSETLNSLVLG